MIRAIGKFIVVILIAVAFVIPVMASPSETIRERITEQIEADREFGAHDLSITARKDSVTLDGVVSSERDRRAVELYARTAARGNDIRNNVKVGYVFNAGKAELAARVRDAIVAKSEATNFKLQVHQNNSHIKLQGVADSEADRIWMEKVARETSGVRSVENSLVVRPPPSDEKIVASVRSAMRQAGEFIPQDLQLSSRQGIVTIKGDFPDHRAVDQALALAIMVPGVKDIQSDIRVNGGPYPLELGRRGEG